jgi:hypothetical protein
MPALVSVTCNPKKRSGDEPEVETVHQAAEPDEPRAAEPPAAGQPCASPLAVAGPLGPVVGPACDTQAAASAADELEERLSTLAGTDLEGMHPLGTAFGGPLSGSPVFMRSVVLQGPPHCYVVLATCTEEAEARFHVTDASTEEERVLAGNRSRFCPPATSSYQVALSSSATAATCAARIYGD